MNAIVDTNRGVPWTMRQCPTCGVKHLRKCEYCSDGCEIEQRSDEYYLWESIQQVLDEEEMGS